MTRRSYTIMCFSTRSSGNNRVATRGRRDRLNNRNVNGFVKETIFRLAVESEPRFIVGLWALCLFSRRRLMRLAVQRLDLVELSSAACSLVGALIIASI